MSCFLDESEIAALAEIQARCDAATPGLWEAAGKEVIHPTGESWLAFYKRAHRSDGKIANNVGRARKEADAELMAHARGDLPFLLDIINRVRKYIGDDE